MLVKQNAHKQQTVWPEADLGVDSASLDKEDTKHDMGVAIGQTVASMLKRDVGHRCLVIIDYCSCSQQTVPHNTVLCCGCCASSAQMLVYGLKDGQLTKQKAPIIASEHQLLKVGR